MKFPAFEPIVLKNQHEESIVTNIPLDKVIPDPNQPRKKFDKESLSLLADSIRQHGVIQPIIVRSLSETYYQIIAGERRWRASLQVKLKNIPAIIKNNGKRNDTAISLIENIQREDLNPIELAEALYYLNKKNRLSHEEIAMLVGKRRTTITNLLRLLHLAKVVRDLLMDGKLEMGHARSLLSLPKEQQIYLANKIAKEKLTVREVERTVFFMKNNKKTKKNKGKCYVQKTRDWVSCLSQKLPYKVSASINKKGEGRIIFHFSSTEDADLLVEEILKIEK